MRLFRKFIELREANASAASASQAILEDADRDHAVALAKLEEVTAQANTLSTADRRNHYSESLTHAFRGRTA